MNNMYNVIAKLCHERGVNITQMCRDANVPRGSLTDLKKGRATALSTKTLSKIAEYFDVSVDYLIVGKEVFDMALSNTEDEKSTKKEPANDGELSKKQLMLIDFARSVPADKVDLALRVMQSIVEDD